MIDGAVHRVPRPAARRRPRSPPRDRRSPDASGAARRGMNAALSFFTRRPSPPSFGRRFAGGGARCARSQTTYGFDGAIPPAGSRGSAGEPCLSGDAAVPGVPRGQPRDGVPVPQVAVGPQDADDAFQETFLAALRAYPRVRAGQARSVDPGDRQSQGDRPPSGAGRRACRPTSRRSAPFMTRAARSRRSAVGGRAGAAASPARGGRASPRARPSYAEIAELMGCSEQTPAPTSTKARSD